ncbi:NitT/TauT family transport system substrate-binding protein [Nakamurella sp. UYEF19]|uniref:ABC transporter substrate-binding protein n=1 Tax=Nakamurella sp. UYEF19 TaxID=1756392 RepID=UPI003391679C
MNRRIRTVLAVATAVATGFTLAACGSSSTTAAGSTTPGSTTSAAGAPSSGAASSGSVASSSSAAAGPLVKVKIQLQWFNQAQFAGYIVALNKGFYKDEGLDVTLLEGGTTIVPQTVLAQGQADYAIAWVPKALQSREQGAAITDVAQVFQRSGTTQVSFKDKNITGPADLKGKKVGNWGFGNEFELFAGMTKAGLDPSKDVTLVQQQFDMNALLNGDIDAAQAMVYNEYAQVLEAKDPKTGKLYTAADFNVMKWADQGTSMLQDAIWADTRKLADPTYQATTVKMLTASFKGWIYCSAHAAECRDIVVKSGSKLGASHQLWQMNEINKLIWPSTAGIGIVNTADWDRTVSIAQTTKNSEGKTVLTKAPDKDAYTNTYAQKAIDALKAQGLDTTGAGFKPLTVTLNAGGA